MKTAFEFTLFSLILSASVLAGATAHAQDSPTERFVRYVPQEADARYPNTEEGRAACLRLTRGLLRAHLAEQDPPITIVPSEEWIEKNLITSSVPTSDGLIQLKLELTPEQMRQLRSEQRMYDSGRLFGVILAGIGVVFLFLRLDHWTRGYLTVPLSVALVALLGGGILLLLKWFA